eukprot:6832693-Pyramimonas_sp.AAC.1
MKYGAPWRQAGRSSAWGSSLKRAGGPNQQPQPPPVCTVVTIVPVVGGEPSQAVLASMGNRTPRTEV